MLYQASDGSLVVEFGHGDVQFGIHGNIMYFDRIEPGEVGREVNPHNFPIDPKDGSWMIVDKEVPQSLYPVFLKFVDPKSVDIFITALERVKQNLVLMNQKESEEEEDHDEIVTEDSLELAWNIDNLLIKAGGRCMTDETFMLLAALLDDHKRSYLSRQFVKQEQY